MIGIFIFIMFPMRILPVFTTLVISTTALYFQVNVLYPTITNELRDIKEILLKKK